MNKFDYSRSEPYLVPFDGSFQIADHPTTPPKSKKGIENLADSIKLLDDLQQRLYAQSRHALLVVFQAMDAGGKDSAIRAVFTGVNPAGCNVTSFKAPHAEEIAHDFLWRIHQHVPQRGKIGVFNRSHYEDVLIARVHPKLLGPPAGNEVPNEKFWRDRLKAIVNFEHHLAQSHTVILKFWLNISLDEQAKRFRKRLKNPDKNWKFSAQDIYERRHWPAYMEAYEEALKTSSKPWAPWFAIPADDKPVARRIIAQIIVQTLQQMNLHYPPPLDVAEVNDMRDLLKSEIPPQS